MAVLKPGETFVIIPSKLRWAPRFTKLPTMATRIGDPWPLGWVDILDTVNGIAVTHRAPKGAVNSEERKRIGSHPNQGGGTAIAFQALTYDDKFWNASNNLSQVAIPGQASKYQLAITSGATAAGNVSVVLDGIIFLIPIAATDTTPALVAAKIAAVAYAGWGAVLGTGADTNKITFTSSTTGPRRGAFSYAPAAGMGAAGTLTHTQLGHASYNSRYVDEDADHNIMIGFEGRVVAGSIFPVDTMIRGLGYNAENTQNGAGVFRHSGADSLQRPNLVMEALPEQLQPEQLELTGITPAALDPERKFNYFDQPIAA